MNIKKFKSFTAGVVLSVLIGGALVVSAYSGGSPKVVVEGDYIEAQSSDRVIGISDNASRFTDVSVENDLVVYNSLSHGGGQTDVSASGATYDLSVSEACDEEVLSVTALGAIATIRFPATTTSFFDRCLPVVGHTKSLWFKNAGSTTSTVVGSAGGGTIDLANFATASTTIAASAWAKVDMFRDSATTYRLFLTNF